MRIAAAASNTGAGPWTSTSTTGRGRARAGAERRGPPARTGHLRGPAGLLAHSGWQARRQAERVAEVRRLLDAHGPGLERDRAGRRLAGGSGQAAEGARRRHRRLWQPPPLAGTDRDWAGGRAAP